MPSLIFFLLTSFFFLLTLDLCSPSPQNGPHPTGPPSAPTGPGFDCTFHPVTGFGPDPTTPKYNAALVSQYSVSEFIQCAGEDSKLAISDDSNSNIKALDVLVKATTTCGQDRLSEVIQNYSKTDQKVKLTRYLCGNASDSDVCALSKCLGAKAPEHSLKGICQNDNVNLWDNPQICGGSGGDGAEPATTTDKADKMATASLSITVAEASGPTVTPSTSSSPGPATTTLPTQIASSSPAGSPSTSLGSSLNATSRMLAAGCGELIAAGLFLIVLMASL